MKKRSTLAAALVLAAMTAWAAQAQETLRGANYYARLTNESAEGGPARIRELSQGGELLRRPNLRPILMQWVKDRVTVSLDPDPNYALIYSDLLASDAQALLTAGKAGEAREKYAQSLHFLRMFEAIAKADAARCADKSLAEPVQPIVQNREARFATVIHEFSAQQREALIEEPLAHEQKLADRPKNTAVCADPGANKPRFIEDQAWQGRRMEIREALKQRWRTGESWATN